jgi:hypothetical protein
MKALILSFLIWAGLIQAPLPVVINGYDPGGDVGTYLLFWDRINQTGAPIVIDGACVSACTFVLAEIPPDRICVTTRASLGVHQARTGDSKDGGDPEVTALLQNTFYPAWLRTWIKEWEAAHGSLTLEVVYVPFEDLKKHYRVCTELESPIAGEVAYL